MLNVINSLHLVPGLGTLRGVRTPEHSQLIKGYGDHVTRLIDQIPDLALFNLAKVQAAALHVTTFLNTATKLPAIREIQVIGHSDRVWKNGVFGARDIADEDRVSQERADDIWFNLVFDLRALKSAAFDIDRFMANGVIQVIVVGRGARELVASAQNVEPENRRVEILLFTTQSTIL
jgi:flagellar motor protein MotB